MNGSDRSPEWLSLPSSSASPLRSRPPVSLRPCGPVDDGIDESEACAAGARTSLDRTPAKLRSPPIPNPRRPHRGGLLEDGLLSEQPDLIQPTQSECWFTAQSKAPTSTPSHSILRVATLSRSPRSWVDSSEHQVLQPISELWYRGQHGITRAPSHRMSLPELSAG